MAARVPGGHRRTYRRSEGDPGRVRRMKRGVAESMDLCRYDVPCGWCYLCRPDPYDEEDDRA